MVIRFMKRKTRIFSLIMAFALMLTAIVPGFIQNEKEATVNAATEIITTDNLSGTSKTIVIVTGDEVYFRSTPTNSISTNILYKLRRGSSLQYIGIANNNYYYVYDSSRSLYGYVSASYSSKITNASYDSSNLIHITGNGVYVRSLPSISSSTVCSVNSGATLIVRYTSGDFIKYNQNSNDQYYWLPVYYAGESSSFGYIAIARRESQALHTEFTDPFAIWIKGWIYGGSNTERLDGAGYYSIYTIADRVSSYN